MLVSTAGTRRIRFRVEGTSQVLDELPTVTASVSRIRGIHRCSVPFKGETFEGVVIVGSDAVWKLGVPNADMVCPFRPRREAISTHTTVMAGAILKSTSENGVAKKPLRFSIALFSDFPNKSNII